MNKVFIIAICVFICAGSITSCRKPHEKTMGKVVDKGPSAQTLVDFDEKKKSMTIKTKDGNMITRAEPGGGIKKIEIKDAEGNITQSYEGSHESGKVTFKDKQGNVSTYEAGVQVTAKDLGIPFYKSAQLLNSTRAESAGFGSATQVLLETSAAFDKVAAFYGKVAPRSAFSSDRDGQDGHVALWTWKDGAFQYSVTISDQINPGKITITLSKVNLQ